MPITIRSNAKLNLHLEVTGTLPSGYHLLETVFIPISFEDTLTFSPHPYPFLFTCSANQLETDHNLIVQAYNQLYPYFRSHSMGVAIHLNKRIPTGGGLGGGSSNAAMTLIGLNQYYQLGLTREQLATYAIHLGADVPFFLWNTPCFAKGIGEHLIPLCTIKQQVWFFLVFPGIKIETRWAYKQVDRLCYTPVLREQAIFDAIQTDWDWNTLGTLFINRFEDIVFNRYPQLGQMHTWLNNQPDVLCARMTGSGSTLFALVSEYAALESLARTFHTMFPGVRVGSATPL